METKTIDILTVVDAKNLHAALVNKTLQPGTQAKPTSLGSYAQSDTYITMITDRGHIVDNDGKSELTISASKDDNIRWSMTTFSQSLDYTAYIYGGDFNPSTAVSKLQFDSNVDQIWLPPSNDPGSTPTSFNNQVYFQSTQILQSAVTIQYNVKFALVENSSGKVIGYFYWDPFIKVS